MQLDVTSRNVEVFLFTNSQGTGYTRGDPINHSDPGGLDDEAPNAPTFVRCPDGTYKFFGGSACPGGTVIGTWFTIVTFDCAGLNMHLSAMRTTLMAAGLLSDKLKEEANTTCGQLLQLNLQGNGITDWNAVAGMITYFDINQDEGEMSVRDLPGAEQASNWGYPDTNLWGAASDVASRSEGMPYAFVLGSNVVLTSVFYMSITPAGMATTTTAQREESLWHEFWHIATGMNDGDIVRNFIDPNFSGDVSTSSMKFDSWLKGGCKKQ